MIKLTRHQALAFVDWSPMPLIAPELADFKVKLQRAIRQLESVKDKDGNCPECAQTQYLGWERQWLQKLNEALNAHQHLTLVAEQFLSSHYEHVARQHMENRFRAEVDAKATQKAGQE